ncbi:agmatinase family protein [Phytohabitans houttuyneae]|uniref:agmatinase family protein n=1 Tax=Phytohabitans houttuyneae TaxID=1076126 RepID=UPI001C49B653|nr:agmatinase family protein [Phytohabitans houttuyneae]
MAHIHDNYGPEARYAVEREAELPTTKWDEEVARGLELGLPGADSIVDRRIPTFSRGELPHFAGINTFLKAPYLEDVRRCGEYDVAVLGAPFDGGTTYRSGTRFGPQGIRKISALYGPYSFELGVDLRESITIADLGDVFTIPANIEKTFDQISKAVGHVYASGAFPVVLGGDHSIGYPTVRGVAEHLDGNLGIIHFDRHVDTQETDLDERMHTTPWFHATDIPNVPPKNLVQIGIGGWQAPRPGSRSGASAARRS